MEAIIIIDTILIFLIIIAIIITFILIKKEALWNPFPGTLTGATATTPQPILNDHIYVIPTGGTFTFAATKKYDTWSVNNNSNATLTVKYGTATTTYTLQSKTAAVFVANGDKFNIVSGNYS